ncbi:efflux RND transporter periplasmic adaptor subunit [Fulvivirga sp. M361]|uniref:efflux RND transporter periplasmic adaptor subunit n=1 Tax=Fulvivirga sp. M361 TaxID=2594266 RepID=UPI001179D681|nr:efflux RND transporter periplasmic adaptor subunit [Fulvivirga sp. M361]TRX48601.1 efflux RND transporter periplasmic adaptor subunit [Fulvivirga sp. M361]
MKLLRTIILLIFTALISCTQEQPAKNEVKNDDNDMITLSMEQVKITELETSVVKQQVLTQTVHANGYLEAPPNQKAEVSTFVTGYVSSIKVLVGEKVTKGQVLAVISSPEFLRLQQEYTELKSQFSYIQATYERNKMLSEEKINAKKDLLKSEAEYLSSKTKLDATGKTLNLLGVNLDDLNNGKISGHLYITAPIEGEVSEIHTVIGKQVEPSKPLFQIISSDHLHAELKIFESDMNKVSIDQQVQFAIPQLSEQTYLGAVYLVSTIIDDAERYVRVHAHVNGDNESFKIGAYIEAEITTERKEVAAVEEQSLISIDDKVFIYAVMSKDTEGYQLKPVEIKTGSKSKGWVEVTDLDPDTEYVSKGAYYLSTL